MDTPLQALGWLRKVSQTTEPGGPGLGSVPWKGDSVTEARVPEVN